MWLSTKGQQDTPELLHFGKRSISLTTEDGVVRFRGTHNPDAALRGRRGAAWCAAALTNWVLVRGPG